MPDWVWIAVFVVAYVLLTRWILPRLGVPTWGGNNCAGSRPESGEENLGRNGHHHTGNPWRGRCGSSV